MNRAVLLLLALSLPAMASAADRTVGIGSFDRLRVEGPFRVTVAAGSPRATVTGERRIIEQVELRTDGSTLVVRMGSGLWGEQRVASDTPVTVALVTPALVSASLIGNADLAIARMKGQRVDVSASGAGTIAVGAVDADQFNVTVIGTGAVKASGRAARARLLTNGPGTIDAGGVATDELTVRLDGAGETQARARFSAQVVNTGLGHVTVVGNPKCTIKASAGGQVSCGPKL